MKNQTAPAVPSTKPAKSGLQKTLNAYWRYRYLVLLMIPSIVVLIIFKYVPIYGVTIAFKNFRIRDGIMGSPWVGLDVFRSVFALPVFWQAFRNTLILGVMNLVIGFPMPILLALLLNELRNERYKKCIQTFSYLPHFISWVIMFSLMYSLFSITNGLINKFLTSLGMSAINMLSDPKMFYGMLYGTSIWKEAGWGTIIFMAAIAGVDQEMYEAAYLDGANRFQQCVHITLPAIAFSVTTMLILNVGSVMGANFDQIMNLRTAATQTGVARVIDTYVYDMGVAKGEYDLSTAIGLFQQIVNCILLFVANAVVNRINGEGFF